MVFEESPLFCCLQRITEEKKRSKSPRFFGGLPGPIKALEGMKPNRFKKPFFFSFSPSSHSVSLFFTKSGFILFAKKETQRIRIPAF
jgi:hypothetical protein